MPRAARLVIPNCPHHVIQRGHNRQVVFANDQDYQYYLANLWEWKAYLHCKIYAYCLMTNHVHLIIDPGREPAALGKLMKRVAGRQTRYVNRLETRTGSFWEGRYKSSPVDTDEYLLACCRYVELNPVRAHMVTRPDQHPWSSYRAKVGLAEQAGLDLDPAYLGLGDTPTARIERYRQWVNSPSPTKNGCTSAMPCKAVTSPGVMVFAPRSNKNLDCVSRPSAVAAHANECHRHQWQMSEDIANGTENKSVPIFLISGNGKRTCIARSMRIV